MITVRELIEQLKELPQDAPVYVYADHGQTHEQSSGASLEYAEEHSYYAELAWDGRHFRNVYGLAYQKLNGYAVHNTEVLLFVMGFQGGTVHQVAKYLETTTDDILYADNERMQDLMRKAQKLGRSRKLSEEKMSEAIFGAGNHDFNPESPA